jgi:osmotically-inducible protein OsmY
MTSSTPTARRRTDADIFAEARKALDERPSIPATVHVHIGEGVAWLTGTVRRATERIEAEDVVRHVDGVQRVVNRITVAEPPDEEDFGPPAA